MIDNKLTLAEHLEELRGRVIRVFICVVIAAGFLYNFVDQILPHLARPVGRLVFVAPQEAFVTHVKIACFGGLFLASPFVIYQLWGFISAGLNASERKTVLLFGPLSFVLFLLGGAFGYLTVVPMGINFLMGFSSETMVPMITASQYVSFIGTLTLAFGAVFQLPLLILFLTKIGIVTPQFLSGKRKHAVVLAFVVAAVLTPPDVVTQFLMAGPLLVLYEAGILFSKFAYKPI